MKLYRYLILVMTTLMVLSCNDSLLSPNDNQAPETSLFLDSIRNQQNSRVFVSWSGDDPDGMVVGYVYSWDRSSWYFTRKNDSTFALQVQSADTNFVFSIAAIDNSLKQYPSEGAQVNFLDKNNNNLFDFGEQFPELQGAIDQSPAQLSFPIKNSPPIIAWGNDTTAKSAQSVVLPDTTFAYATFKIFVSDPDGDATLESVQWSLNDSTPNANWRTLPKGTRLFSVSTKDGLIPNADNVIYMKAKDIGKLSSPILRYPSSGKTWYVRKTKGPILLIKDCANKDIDDFYARALSLVGSGMFTGKYDVLDINTTRTADAPAKTIPPFINPMFIESLKLYSAVIWYTDKSPSTSLAQQSLTEYIRFGGKVLFIADLPAPLSEDMRTEIRDFSPVDSIGKNEVSSDPLAIRNGTEFIAMNPGGTMYPNLTKERGSVLVYPLYPKANAKAIYTLTANPKWQGMPILGVKDDENTMVFLHMPLHLLNVNDNAIQLIRNILIDEFNIR
ncbi:MAG: hypothetical protein ACO323_01075 [Candidatus Kapaibacteriota bacterium]